jgi:YgiT-type zinc finger domain-containing protein
MRCAICKNGSTVDGRTTIVLDKDDIVLVFQEVPAKICDNCGEEYLSAETNRRLLHLAKDAKQRGVALELVKFAA